VANNVVPDECTFVVNRRFAPSRTIADAEAELRALLVGADEIEVVSASPAASPNLNNPLVAEFVGTLDIAVRPKLGWTDVARFASRGVPAMNYGPGDPTLAHTSDERVDRGDIEGCFNVLAHFLGLRVRK
jgi:succinyl-diaminopimelate desuccinylase